MHSDGFLELILDSDYHEKILSLYLKIREVRRVFVFWERHSTCDNLESNVFATEQTWGFPALCNI